MTSARQQRDADELARLPQSGGIFAMRVDVPGPARARVRRLSASHADADALRPHRVPAPRRAAEPRRDPRRARRSRRRPATSSKCRATARACSGCASARTRSPTTASSSARTKACTVAHGRRTALDVHRGRRRRSRSPARRCASASCIAARRSLGSITDEHFRGWTRLPTFGRVRQGGQWIAAFALASGEPVYGLGEKFGPLNKRGQLDPLAGRRRARRQHRPRVQERAVRLEPGHRQRRMGRLRAHAGDGDARRRASRLVASLVRDAASTTRRSTSSCSPPTRRPASSISTRSSPAARRAGAAVEPRPVGLARLLQDARGSGRRSRRSCARARFPCDVLTLDGRAAWNVETRFDFEWDPDALPGSARGARRDQGAPPARLRLGISVRLGALAAVRRARVARLPADQRATATRTCSAGTRRPATSPFGNVLTPLPESGIVDFTHPGAYAWWRDAHAALFADGVDVIKSDFGEQVPDDAVAFNGDRGRRLHNVYPLLYNQCVFEATAKFQRDRDAPPMVWGRAGWTGSQRYPIQWGGDPQSDWEGLAASIRGGLSWGMSGAPYHASDIGGFYGSQQPSPELYRALAAGGGVQLAHPRARHRRARALGVRRRGRGDRAQVARVPLSADSVSAARDRRGGRDRHAGDARDAARVSRQRAHARLRDAVHVRRRAARRADRRSPAARSRSRCRRARGTTSIRASASPASACCATRRRSTSFRCSAAKATRCRSGRAVQHTGEIDAARPLEQLWVFGKPTRPLARLRAGQRSTPARDGAFAIDAAAGRQGRASSATRPASTSPSLPA